MYRRSLQLGGLFLLLTHGASLAQRSDGGGERQPDSQPEFSRTPDEAPAARILTIESVGPVAPDGGKLIYIKAETPKYELASVEHLLPGEEEWTAVDDEVFSADGTVEFHIWTDQPRGFFRVVSRPVPTSNLIIDEEPRLEVDGAVRSDLLSLYLRTERGASISPPPSGDAPFLVQPTAAPARLSELGMFGTLSGDTRTTGDLASLGGIKEAYERPRLSLVSAVDEVITSTSAVIGESLKVPLGWRIANEGVKRARYVLQQSPFSDPSAYTTPPAKSVTGWIENPGYPSNDSGVAFYFNFSRRVFGKIEPPEAFFLRIYEEDAEGNIIGWPSNTFSFVVNKESPPIPSGKLRFKLSRIKCWDTTGEHGNDEVTWSLLRVKFGEDKVICDYPTWGYHVFGKGEATYPSEVVLEHQGSSEYPNVDDTWYIFSVKEIDIYPLSGDSHEKWAWPGDNPAVYSHLATGMLKFGASQAEILEAIREHSQFESWWEATFSDRIGQWTFRLNRPMIDHAVEHGLRRKNILMHGNNSSYTTWFDLEFFPY